MTIIMCNIIITGMI